jgi:Ca-activated chloride channel family protein
MMKRIIPVICFAALIAAPAWADEVQVSAPDQVAAGASFPVRIESGIEKGDQVTIGTADGEPVPDARRAYPAAGDSEAALAAPVEPGDYTVVVLRANNRVAARPIKVAAPAAKVAAPERATMRQEIDVRYEGPANPGDHVTYVEADGSRLLYVPRGYAKERTEGVLKLPAPEKPGQYRVAYVTGGKVLASAPIQVDGASARISVPDSVPTREPFEATVEGPANPGDFLTLGDAKGMPIALAAQVELRGEKRDTLRMMAPQLPGEYTVIYQSGTTVLATVPLKAEGAKGPK